VSKSRSTAIITWCESRAHMQVRIDVELIVREDHEVLKGIGARAGVVQQPVKRVVDPRTAEERERRDAAIRLPRTIHDGIVDCCQARYVEEIAQWLVGRRCLLPEIRRFEVDVVLEGEMDRDRFVRLVDLDCYAVA